MARTENIHMCDVDAIGNEGERYVPQRSSANHGQQRAGRTAVRLLVGEYRIGGRWHGRWRWDGWRRTTVAPAGDRRLGHCWRRDLFCRAGSGALPGAEALMWQEGSDVFEYRGAWMRFHLAIKDACKRRARSKGGSKHKKDPSLLVGALVALGVLLLIVVLCWSLTGSTTTTSTAPIEISYSAFYQNVKDENVQRVILQGQDIRGTLKQGVTVTDPTTGKRVTGSTFHLFQLPNGDPTLTALLIQYVPDVETTTVSDSDGETTTVSDTTVWLDLLFALVLAMPVFIVLFLLACSLLQRQQNPFSPGKKAKIMRKHTSATTFADVAGVDEAKDDLVEMVELLKRPQQLQRLGGKLPRGILLVGPPGTGKTLLARAVAGEAGVPFFSMSGSAFVEVLAGLGASRVRNLFTQAKKAAPSIIFIDEIDAVGRQRRTSITSNEEREQTL